MLIPNPNHPNIPFPSLLVLIKCWSKLLVVVISIAGSHRVVYSGSCGYVWLTWIGVGRSWLVLLLLGIPNVVSGRMAVSSGRLSIIGASDHLRLLLTIIRCSDHLWLMLNVVRGSEHPRLVGVGGVSYWLIVTISGNRAVSRCGNYSWLSHVLRAVDLAGRSRGVGSSWNFNLFT